MHVTSRSCWVHIRNMHVTVESCMHVTCMYMAANMHVHVSCQVAAIRITYKTNECNYLITFILSNYT